MPQRDRLVALMVAGLFLGTAIPAWAQPVGLGTELTEARRIFVPAEDLDVVVERDRRGAMLTKQKFEELLALAKANAAKNPAPNLPIVLTSSNYQARVVGDQLLLSVTAELTQFAHDWQSIAFAMQRLSLEKATLDDQPAMVGRNPDGSVSLLSDEKGKHILKLELSTELNSFGSDQVAGFSLLRAPSGTLSLTLPAGKRLLVGALQLERPAPLEQAADYKIAIGGAPAVQLRITDRAAENSADALTFATTGYGLHVAPGEVTWHALTTLQVFGKPIDRLTFSVPSTLEIADIEATGLESWDLKDDPDDKSRTVISLTFGQAFDGSRKISFKGVMAVEAGKPWTVPALSIANVTSHIGQIVVQHPAGVRLRVEESEGVRRATQEQKPTTDMPDDMSKLNATEFLRFDIWQPDFVLRLTTQPKQREVQTAVAAVLDVNATGLDLQALITVKTQFAPLFELDVRLPADWTVLSAQRDGVALKWQVLSQEPGVNQLRILLAPPLAAEASGTVRLALRRDVEGWPVEADPITVDLPELFLPQSNLNEGTFVVRGDDDLDLATLDLTGLDTVPLKADFERLRFQSQDSRYGGKLKVTRKPSRISVQTITVSRLDPQTMHAFVQAMVEVQGGGVRTLKVVLPESAGTALRFQSPTRQIVEQKPSAVQNGERTWTLQLDQRVRGLLPLFCDIELPRGGAKEFVVPQAKFVDAERQNGFQAVEAGGEQRLTIDARAADGSTLSEVDPLDLPNLFYIPKERIVGVYQNVTAGAKLTLSEERFDKLAVPTAVCPLLNVTSVLGRTGEFQHRAHFQLTAVGVQGLRVTLPPQTVLWATLVDGQPVEVRRQGDIYLVPLNSGASGSMPSMDGPHVGLTRTLQLFYRSEVPPLTRFGSFEQPPPELSVQTGQGTSQPVDVLDQHWQLNYPPKTLLVGSNGPLEPEQPLDETSLLGRLNTGVRVPTLVELGWQIFSVVVTLGVIALFVMAYRKGVHIAVTGFVLILIGLVGFAAMWTFTAQEQKNSLFYAGTAEESFDASPKSAAPIPVSGWYADESEDLMRVMDAPSAATEVRVQDEAMKSDEKSEEWAREQPDVKKQPIAISGAPNEKWKDNLPAKNDGEKKQDTIKEIAREELAQLQPNDPQAKPADPEAAKPKGRSGKDRLALLSLAIELAAPEGSLQKTFRYAGADPARGGITLKLTYIDEHSGTVVRVFLVALVALMGWFLRGSNCATKTALAALGLTLPLALLPLVPQALQVVLDGAFFGAIAVCGLWLLVGLMHCLARCCVNCCNWGKRNATGPNSPSGPAGATLTAWLAATMLIGGQAYAQKGVPATQPPAPVQAQPSAPPANPQTTLVVPFDVGTDPLAADRILLPFDKFVELYRQAYPDKPMKGMAPHDGGVVEALYAAKIIPNEKTPDESTVEVTARYAVRSYVDGQLQVELPVGAVAARQAKLDGKNAPLIVNGACSKVAISTPGLHVVDFVFSIPARLSGSTGSVTLPLLPVPSGKLSLTLPAKNLSIRVNGSSTIFRRVTQGEVQSIEFPVDKGGDLAIAWQPEQAKGAAAAVVHVDSVQAVLLTDAGIRVSTGFQYRVRQGGIADVTFSLPATYRLQAVNGADVGGWELQGDGDDRKLRVIFRRNVTDASQLTVEAFLDVRVGVEATLIDIPQLAPLEVTNEIGQVAVFSGNQFTLRADKVESLAQIDADKFNTAVPVSRPNVAPQLAYRFSKRPFTLSLRAARQESQANVAAQQAAFVTLRKQQLTTRLVYNLTGAPRSSFHIALPAGYVVLDVKATGLHDWSLGKQNDETSLTIDLNGPRLGLAEVVLSGTVPRDNGAASASLVFPRPLDATKLNSAAAVWLDEGFTGTLDTFDGWRSVDASLVSDELKSVRPNLPIQFAFSSTSTSPSPVTLKLQQATAKLTANGLAMVSVTDVAVIHTLALQWQIDGATTDSLVFTTPSFLAGKLEFTGNGIRETKHADAGNDRTRWTIWLRTPISGKYFAAAVATLPPAATEVQAPSIEFERASGQRQYVLLINLSQSQLTSATPELSEAVQREDVPVVVDQSLVDQATELVRVKQLLTAPRWTLQKFAQTATAPASVNVADLTTIVSRDGTYRGQAVYTIKNHSRQFLALKLPENAELMSVFVGQQPSRAVTTKRNNSTYQLIALPKTSVASLSFPVRVIWRDRLDGVLPRSARLLRQEIDFPAPVVVSQQDDVDFGIPVAKTRWTVYLPDDLDAQPLKTSTRNNLTLQESDKQDLLYEKAAIQELSELLGFVESNYSSSSKSASGNRAQANNNMKQVGLAFDNVKQLEQAVRNVRGDTEFDQQRELALKRLSDVQQSIVADQNKANLGDQVLGANVSGESVSRNMRGVQVQMKGLTEPSQIVNVISNSNALIQGNNTIDGIQLSTDASRDNFFFGLKNADESAKAPTTTDPSGKPSSGKGSGKSANLETRLGLQAGNDANIDALNRSINDQKGVGQQQAQEGLAAQQQAGQYHSPPASMMQRPSPMVDGPGPGVNGLVYGGPASLQSHTVRNRTSQNLPSGTQHMLIDIDHKPGLSLPPSVDYIQFKENMPVYSPGELQSPSWNKNKVDGEFSKLVTEFDDLVRQKRFAEAEVVAKKAKETNPNDPTSTTMFWKARLGRRADENSKLQNSREDSFMEQLNDVESAAIVKAGDDRPLAFGDNRRQLALRGAGGAVGAPGGGHSMWTQTGGLSLGFELPTTGRKLVFSKAGGDPKLALAVRPQESVRWGLNLVWSVIWLAIGLAIIAATRSGRIVQRLSRQLPVAAAVLGALGFVILPCPLSGCAFVIFVMASLVVAWINRAATQAAQD